MAEAVAETATGIGAPIVPTSKAPATAPVTTETKPAAPAAAAPIEKKPIENILGESVKTPEAEAKPVVTAEKYEAKDLKLPEGAIIDAAMAEKIAAFSSERGFSKDHAQAILESHNQAVKSHVDAAMAGWNATTEKWLTELREVHGSEANLGVAQAGIMQVLRKYPSGPKVAEFLNETGYGRNPVIFNFLHEIWQGMKPATFVRPQGQPSAKSQSVEDRLFGDMFEKKGS